MPRNRNIIETSDGNVGIGTTSPARRLHVSNTGFAGFEFGAGVGSLGGNELLNYNRSTSLYVSSEVYASAHIFYSDTSGGTRALDISSNGNIGIGTTSPSDKLHIVGNLRVGDGGTTPAGSGLTMGSISGSYKWIQSFSSQPLYINPLGNNVIFNRDGGSVAIGTTSPFAKFDVWGDITLDSASATDRILYFRNQSTSTGATIRSDQSLSFYAGSSNSPTQVITLERNTLNVGVGTTSPFTKLTVASTTISGADISLYTTNTSGGTTSRLSFRRNYTIGNNTPFLAAYIANHNYDDSNNSNNRQGLSFFTKSGTAEPVERIRIDGDGNVGIGTTNPSGKLHIWNGNIHLVQGYNITWNNGDNYISGVSGYHVDTTTYDGVSAQQSGFRVVGGTSKSARTISYGGHRYGRALDSGAATKCIKGWHNWFTTSVATSPAYVHFKTNMWAGGSPNGNIQFTMSLFRATGYDYSALTIDSLLGFHNWSGTHYSVAITNLGSKNFWQSPYVSADGYTVLVGLVTGASYLAVSIDWNQVYGYPFIDAWVTAETVTNSATGAY